MSKQLDKIVTRLKRKSADGGVAEARAKEELLVSLTGERGVADALAWRAAPAISAEVRRRICAPLFDLISAGPAGQSFDGAAEAGRLAQLEKALVAAERNAYDALKLQQSSCWLTNAISYLESAVAADLLHPEHGELSMLREMVEDAHQDIQGR